MNIIDQVGCPFRIHLPAGASTFEVEVPRVFSDRKFHFSKLILSPDYFSQQAAYYDQDLDEDLQAHVNGYHMYATLRFSKDALFPAEQFVQSITTAKTIDTLLRDINNYFEVNKPTGMTRSPLFFDWIDQQLEDAEDDLTEAVQELALTYYDTEFDPSVHGNALPPSVRDLPRVNNTVYPEKIPMENVADRIRIRLHLSPEMSATFSTDVQLKTMGFSTDDYGKRSGKNRFLIKNETDDYLVLTASNPPFGSYTWSTNTLTRVQVAPTSDTWISHVYEFDNLTVENDKSNALVAKEIAAGMKKIADWSNWTFSSLYDDAEHLFQFGFPVNDNLRATLYVSEPLALRLGYGMVRSIESHNQPKPKLEVRDIKESTKMALALAYDTGLVIVSVKDSSSNTTSNIDNQFMASLEPEHPGVLKMIPCESTVGVFVPYHKTGSGPYANIKFELFRFNEAGHPIEFAWKTGAFLNGVLSSNPYVPPTALAAKRYKKEVAPGRALSAV